MLSEPGSDQRVSFEEFKLYYDSAEKVTDRRVDANRWNYSICTAILVALGAVAAWALTHRPFLVPAVLAIVALSAMAALYCSLWIGQIRDLKELNNAKFVILNEMAPKLLFGDRTDERVSYCPFEREWKMLKNSQATQQMTGINIIALRSSNIEYLIPKALRAVFLLVSIGAILEMALKFPGIP